jgi:hypothetical protein
MRRGFFFLLFIWLLVLAACDTFSTSPKEPEKPTANLVLDGELIKTMTS